MARFGLLNIHRQKEPSQKYGLVICEIEAPGIDNTYWEPSETSKPYSFFQKRSPDDEYTFGCIGLLGLSWNTWYIWIDILFYKITIQRNYDPNYT